LRFPSTSNAQRHCPGTTLVRTLPAYKMYTIPSTKPIFYARNVRTTVLLGHARGVILLAAAHADLEIHEYPPSEIKKAVAGTGAATKLQIQFMVMRLLRLKSAPQPTDAADGVAAALAYAMMPDLPKIEAIRLRTVP